MIKMLNSSQEPPAPTKAPIQDLSTWMFFAPSWSIETAKNSNMSVSATSDNIQIMIKIQNPNKDLKDMDVLHTFEIKIESQNLENWFIKDQWI